MTVVDNQATVRSQSLSLASEGGGFRRFLKVASLVSGAAALIFEVVWMRYCSYLFGQSHLAVAAVVTGFMLGLGFGSIIFGRRVDRTARPIRLFVLLELGIGLSGILFPLVFRVLSEGYLWVHASHELSGLTLDLLRFGLSCALLAVPAAFMGGTLPVMAKLYVHGGKRVDRGTGVLYFANNVGAVFGAFLCGFFLLENLGLLMTSFIAAGMNFSLCAATLLLFWYQPERTESEEGRPSPVPPPGGDLPGAAGAAGLAAFLGAGFVSLALEVLWTRVLVSTYLASTVYSFTLVLMVFIGGLAIGAFLYARILFRVRYPVFLFGLLQILIGLAALGGVGFLKVNFRLFSFVWTQTSQTWAWHVLVGLMITMTLMLVPTVLMGVNLPLYTRVSRSGSTGELLGRVLFFQTLANAAGSFAAGIVLVRLFGLQGSFVALGVASAALGLLVMQWSSIRRVVRLGAVPAAVLAVTGILWVFPVKQLYDRPMAERQHRLLFYEEGPASTVTVQQVYNQYDGKFYKRLRVDGLYVAGTEPTIMTDQKVLAHLPLLLLGGKAGKTLTVGFGSGTTSHTMSLHEVGEVNCVEINPQVLDAAPFFNEVNGGMPDRSGYRVYLDDARSFMEITGNRYDVISSDCTDLAYYGNATLYSLDYFRACRRKLSPRGIMCAWVPLSNLDLEDFQSIVRTFLEVFGHASVWFPTNYRSHYVVLLGTPDRMSLDASEITAVLARRAIADDLAAIDIEDPFKVLSFLMMDEEAARNFAEGAPINSDARPQLEFKVARKVVGEKASSWSDNLEALLESSSSAESILALVKGEEDPGRLKDYLDAREDIIRSYVRSLRKDDASEIEFLERAYRKNPRDVAVRRQLGLARAANLRSIAEEAARRNMFEDALDYYRKALKEAAWQGVTYNEMGVLLAGMGRISEAEAVFRRGLAADPGVIDLKRNVAKMNLQLGTRLPEALELAEAVAGVFPAVDNLVLLSIAQRRNGLREEEAETLRRARSLYPDDKRLADYLKAREESL